MVTAVRSRWMPVTNECSAGRSSAVTAAIHSGRRCPVSLVIMSANAVTCRAAAAVR